MNSATQFAPFSNTAFDSGPFAKEIFSVSSPTVNGSSSKTRGERSKPRSSKSSSTSNSHKDVHSNSKNADSQTVTTRSTTSTLSTHGSNSAEKTSPRRTERNRNGNGSGSTPSSKATSHDNHERRLESKSSRSLRESNSSNGSSKVSSKNRDNSNNINNSTAIADATFGADFASLEYGDTFSSNEPVASMASPSSHSHARTTRSRRPASATTTGGDSFADAFMSAPSSPPHADDSVASPSVASSLSTSRRRHGTSSKSGSTSNNNDQFLCKTRSSRNLDIQSNNCASSVDFGYGNNEVSSPSNGLSSSRSISSAAAAAPPGAAPRARRGRRASLLGSADTMQGSSTGLSTSNFASPTPSGQQEQSSAFAAADDMDYGYGDAMPDNKFNQSFSSNFNNNSHSNAGFGAFEATFDNDDNNHINNDAVPTRQRAARRSSIDVSKFASEVKTAGADFYKNNHTNGGNANGGGADGYGITAMPMVLPDTASANPRRARRASLVGAVGAVGDLVGGAVNVVGAVTIGTTNKDKSSKMLLQDSDHDNNKKKLGFFKERDRKAQLLNRANSSDGLGDNVLASYRGTTERRRVGTLKVDGGSGGAASGSSVNKTSYSDRILNTSSTYK